MKIFYISPIIIILFLLHGYSQTVKSEIKTVSLKECLEMAMQNHPEIKSSVEDKAKAIAQYEFSQSKNRAQVNLEVKTIEYLKETSAKSNQELNIPGKDTVIGLFAGPTVTYNLIDPQRSNQVDASRLGIDLSKMQMAKVREEIICNVKKGYYGFSLARENKELQDKLVNKFKIKLDKAKLLVRTGQRPILDITKGEVDLADAMLEFERAKNHENLMKTELLASMGIFDEEIEFTPIKASQLPQLRFLLKELYTLGEINYPDIKIARIAKEINKINISTAKAGHYPTVDLLGSVGFENTSITDWQNKEEIKTKIDKDYWEMSTHVGLRASMNIYSGGGIDAKVDAAIAEYNKSKYLEKEILIQMKAKIRNYFQSMEEFKKQVEITDLMIKNAEKHLALAQKSYESGISSQLDMQDAELAVIKAEISKIKAIYDYFITLASLSNVVGLGEEYLCQ